MSRTNTKTFSDDINLSVRTKVFSKWISSKLRKKGILIRNVNRQLKNGSNLVNLSEVLTGTTKHNVWTRNPTKSFQFIENLEVALDIFRKDGLKFPNAVTAQRISEGNQEAIEQLIWTLIKIYTIQPAVYPNQNRITDSKSSTTNNAKNSIPIKPNNKSDPDVKIHPSHSKEMINLLSSWLQNIIIEYPEINEFALNHLAFAAVLNKFRPDLLNYHELIHQPANTIATEISKTLNSLKIVNLFETQDFLNHIDQASFFTQLALIKSVLDPPSNQNSDDRNISITDTQTDSMKHFSNSASLCNLDNFNDSDESDNESASSAASSDSQDILKPFKPDSHRPFMLLMRMKDSEINSRVGRFLAMTITDEHNVNNAGYRIDLAIPNPNDDAQLFTFGKKDWVTVIDSVKKPGFVWDVACGDSTNPPEGTPFYLYPFHGFHNQRFAYKNGKIIALQDKKAVTFTGNSDQPFVMKNEDDSLFFTQTFQLHYVKQNA